MQFARASCFRKCRASTPRAAPFSRSFAAAASCALCVGRREAATEGTGPSTPEGACVDAMGTLLLSTVCRINGRVGAADRSLTISAAMLDELARDRLCGSRERAGERFDGGSATSSRGYEQRSFTYRTRSCMLLATSPPAAERGVSPPNILSHVPRRETATFSLYLGRSSSVCGRSHALCFVSCSSGRDGLGNTDSLAAGAARVGRAGVRGWHRSLSAPTLTQQHLHCDAGSRPPAKDAGLEHRRTRSSVN